ncbi:MAG: segregation/condensation protein A [Candidatus Pacearchaeota archaeon]
MNEEAKKELDEGKRFERVGQEQIHGLLFEEKLSWQSIIYDLIRTEQLDPWDIDLGVLTNKYLEKIVELEEANFFISSQVLLAASLLLRLKSEILLDEYIPGLDAILFNKKTDEQKKYTQERIELGEEIPELTLRTPLPRFKKVTLDELMAALGHAIKTENRRIRKVIIAKQQELETALAIPKHRINVKERIREVYSKLKYIFEKQDKKVPFSSISGNTKEEKIATFVPLLHLDNQHKVWLEQEKHFDEIWILLKTIYEQKNSEILAAMRKEAEEAIEKLVEEENNFTELKISKDKNEKENDESDEGEDEEDVMEISESFRNPIDDTIEEEEIELKKKDNNN